MKNVVPKLLLMCKFARDPFYWKNIIIKREKNGKRKTLPNI